MKIEDIERLMVLMNKKKQDEDLTLAESVELRRLATEHVDECGVLVSKKMTDYYHF